MNGEVIKSFKEFQKNGRITLHRIYNSQDKLLEDEFTLGLVLEAIWRQVTFFVLAKINFD
jgi:hypothetical protein